nr:BPC1 [Gladiolus x hybridus]
MDDHGGLGSWGIRNWSYAEPPLPKIDLSWQLMPNRGNFAADIVWEGWINHRDNKNNNPRTTKFPDVLSPNLMYDLNGTGPHPSQILKQPDLQPPQVDNVSTTEENGGAKEAPLKKPKKPKKVAVPKDKILGRSSGKKSEGLVIDGIGLDLSRIPTPVCSCTGELRQCYKWGVGGWQSACCTKSVSEYPLPANMKRRGARIAGRKMSLGAFKKVLETVVREGRNLSNPIDLKPYWAKHGTNKFVTIR